MLLGVGCEKHAPPSMDTVGTTSTTTTSAVESDPRFLHHGGSEWTIFDVDLQRAAISLIGQKPGEPRSFVDLESFLGPDRRDFIMATNAGIFDPQHRPLGLHIQNGKLLVPLSTAKGEGNFYLLPNGVFWLDEQGAHVAATDRYAAHGRVTLATQSGPLLLDAGRLHPAFQETSVSLRVRSGVGVNAQGHVVFVLSRDRVSFHATATLFRDALACPNALYLDGEISAMVAPRIEPRERHEYAGLLVVKRR